MSASIVPLDRGPPTFGVCQLSWDRRLRPWPWQLSWSNFTNSSVIVSKIIYPSLFQDILIHAQLQDTMALTQNPGKAVAAVRHGFRTSTMSCDIATANYDIRSKLIGLEAQAVPYLRDQQFRRHPWRWTSISTTPKGSIESMVSTVRWFLVTRFWWQTIKFWIKITEMSTFKIRKLPCLTPDWTTHIQSAGDPGSGCFSKSMS